MKTISVTSGKGGVGKTTFLVNLALQLKQSGHRVLILDGDLGMSNVDLLFGKKAAYSLWDVMSGSKELTEILVSLAPGVDLISSGSGLLEYNHLDAFQRRSMLEVSQELNKNYDFMLVDTAPGISENVLYLNYAADEIIVLITPDVGSFTDGYALIKVLNAKHKVKRFNIVANMVQDENEGVSVFERFQGVTHRFLEVGLNYLGSVPFDLSLRDERGTGRLLTQQSKISQARRALIDIEKEIQVLQKHKHYHETHANFWSQVVGFA
ncbi:MAG TPA: MinD/ParA family protein [Pseudobdellovibrionaceae bacterium]|nr:MinD/ParA family protein [Pseudobdellovibrionaceae bacterium]